MTNRIMWPIACASLVALAAGPSAASSGFVNQYPNGGPLSCGGCHVGAPADENFNAFGTQVNQNLAGGVNWSALYNLDADNDGCTNGYELGDPDGVWQPGQQAGPVQGNPSTPGDCVPGDGDGGTVSFV